MRRAIEDGRWTDDNIHYNGRLRDRARNEWDQAAENCRKTPGCKPEFRDDGTSIKVLKTDDELLNEKARKEGLSRDGLKKN